MHEFVHELEAAWDVLRSVDEHGPMTTPELVALWLDVEGLRDMATAVRDRLRDDASERVLGEAGPGAETVSAAGEVAHLARGSSPTRWRGRDLTDRLVIEAIDTATGEVLRAVPLDAALRYFSACQEETSSGWRTTGLASAVPDWRRYRHREEAPWVLRRGAKL